MSCSRSRSASPIATHPLDHTARSETRLFRSTAVGESACRPTSAQPSINSASSLAVSRTAAPSSRHSFANVQAVVALAQIDRRRVSEHAHRSTVPGGGASTMSTGRNATGPIGAGSAQRFSVGAGTPSGRATSHHHAPFARRFATHALIRARSFAGYRYRRRRCTVAIARCSSRSSRSTMRTAERSTPARADHDGLRRGVTIGLELVRARRPRS